MLKGKLGHMRNRGEEKFTFPLCAALFLSILLPVLDQPKDWITVQHSETCSPSHTQFHLACTHTADVGKLTKGF